MVFIRLRLGPGRRPVSQVSKRNSNRGFSTVKIGLFFTDRHGTHFKLPHSDHVSAGLFSSLLPSAAVSLRVVLPSSSTQFASSTSYPAPGSARQNQVPISSDYRLFSSSITTTSSVNTQPGCFLYFSSSDDRFSHYRSLRIKSLLIEIFRGFKIYKSCLRQLLCAPQVWLLVRGVRVFSLPIGE